MVQSARPPRWSSGYELCFKIIRLVFESRGVLLSNALKRTALRSVEPDDWNNYGQQLFNYKRKLQTVNLGDRACVSNQRLYKYAKLPGLSLPKRLSQSEDKDSLNQSKTSQAKNSTMPLPTYKAEKLQDRTTFSQNLLKIKAITWMNG